MDKHTLSEGLRLATRTLLYLIVVGSFLKIVYPPHNEVAAPICLTVALAGLACSCRPIGPSA